MFIVAGCGADLLINICLTILGYLPGHSKSHCPTKKKGGLLTCGLLFVVHAFYLLYVYYNRKEQIEQGYRDDRPAPGVYSQNIQSGGQGYGTMGHH